MNSKNFRVFVLVCHLEKLWNIFVPNRTSVILILYVCLQILYFIYFTLHITFTHSNHRRPRLLLTAQWRQTGKQKQKRKTRKYVLFTILTRVTFKWQIRVGKCLFTAVGAQYAIRRCLDGKAIVSLLDNSAQVRRRVVGSSGSVFWRRHVTNAISVYIGFVPSVRPPTQLRRDVAL